MPPRTAQNDTEIAAGSEPNKGGPQARKSRATARETEPFWRTKTLDAMNTEEWESLCDRCGRCCLVKLEDEDTGEILRTDIACKLFDAGACRCIAYETRQKKVADCIKLTPETVRTIRWLPSTCAYRMVLEGRPLEAWHPLVSGSFETVHEAGISVRGRIGGSEKTVKLRHYLDHIVDWGD